MARALARDAGARARRDRRDVLARRDRPGGPCGYGAARRPAFARRRARRAPRRAGRGLPRVHVRRPARGRLPRRPLAPAPSARDGVLLQRRARAHRDRVTGARAPRRVPLARAPRRDDRRAARRDGLAVDRRGARAPTTLPCSSTRAARRASRRARSSPTRTSPGSRSCSPRRGHGTDTDVLLHTLPLHHLHGLGIAMLTAIGAGAAVHFQPFEPRAAWEGDAASHRVHGRADGPHEAPRRARRGRRARPSSAGSRAPGRCASSRAAAPRSPSPSASDGARSRARTRSSASA